MKHTNLLWTDILNLFVAKRFFLLMLGLLLTGCVYTDKPKFQGSASSLIRPGFVKLCTISKINEYKNDTECPIGKVSRQPDGSFAIDDAYQSARGDSGKMFNVVDIGKDIAVLEIQNKSILAEKKMGVRDGYAYQIALKQSNGAYFLYGINCNLPEDTSLKLILADIIIPDGANCNIAGLNREQTVSFFKTLLATKWYVEDGNYTSGMHQFTYQPTTQGEIEYQRRYAQGLADQQKYLDEKKSQELANTKKQEIDWDGVAERYKNELKHQRKMDCLGRGGGRILQLIGVTDANQCNIADSSCYLIIVEFSLRVSSQSHEQATVASTNVAKSA